MENLEIKHFWKSEDGNINADNKNSAEKNSNENQNQTESIDYAEFNKKLDKIAERLVEDILAGKNGEFLGKGMSAKVYLPEENKEVCFKIISYREVEGRGPEKEKALQDPKRIGLTTNIRPHDPEQGYHLPDREGFFLKELVDLDDTVKIPRPFESVSYMREEWGKGYMIKEYIHLLAQERLNAVSVEDVIEGRAELPEKFEHTVFFDTLRKYLKKMHDEAHIFHRDLHQGNIMIDINTGKPCIIDFGKSTQDTEEEAYKKEYADPRGKFITTTYTRDEDFVDEVELLLKKFMEENNK